MPRATKVSAPSQTVVAPTSEHRRPGLRAPPDLTPVPREQIQELAWKGERLPEDRVTAGLTQVIPIPRELVRGLMRREVWTPQLRVTGELKLFTMKPHSTSESPCYPWRHPRTRPKCRTGPKLLPHQIISATTPKP